ncbi:MAG TPA: (2E,6E)-farnesyl diphosphate synthase [Gammaproteobacteria bacterium]|nr:(2E,6E)-farnesyl diphosphate synthase [Gammaproteobacteria bacterium]
MNSFSERLQGYRERVNHRLTEALPNNYSDTISLYAAMRYSLTAGGKRVRPALVYATGEALELDFSCLDSIACAIEIIHTYSLIHDDLPAMDDDDLRRGQPTCHKKYDEATAILAGDALQALAFEILCESEDIPPHTRLHLISALARASGHAGMAYGQAIDLACVGKTLELAQLEHMHQHKTGALIQASVIMPALCVPGISTALIEKLDAYARAIGLAFQIVDDILDIVSDTSTLGKQQGADQARDKPTYPALLGLEGAQKHALEMHEQALASLAELPQQFDVLREFSSYIIQRSY